MPDTVVLPPGVRDPALRTITNKIAGETITFEKYSYETGGELTRVRVTCQPGGGPVFHRHSTVTEHFMALKGRLGLELGEKTIFLEPGQDAIVEIGQPHRFFNDGSEPIDMRIEFRPGKEGLEKGFTISFGLVNDGLGAAGFPQDPVHLGIIMSREWMDTYGVGGVKWWLMNLVASLLGAYGKWRGIDQELTKRYWG